MVVTEEQQQAMVENSLRQAKNMVEQIYSNIKTEHKILEEIESLSVQCLMENPIKFQQLCEAKLAMSYQLNGSKRIF